jgi:hypothetical protein
VLSESLTKAGERTEKYFVAPVETKHDTKIFWCIIVMAAPEHHYSYN